jgi:hypothetical protein
MSEDESRQMKAAAMGISARPQDLVFIERKLKIKWRMAWFFGSQKSSLIRTGCLGVLGR